MNILKKFSKDPFRVVALTIGLIQKCILNLNKNIEMDMSLKLVGQAMVNIEMDCKLLIGQSVTLNSRNNIYHVNMFKPVKIVADRPGAVISIGNDSRIHGSCIHAYEYISIGERCLIAANCQIIDGNGHDISFPNVENRIHTSGKSTPIIIEDDVWLGCGVTVLPGSFIGKGSIISAGSVVNKTIPPFSIAVGNPAIVIRTYSSESK